MSAHEAAPTVHVQGPAIRVATCMRCAHMLSLLENDSLRIAVDCPTCGEPKAFGPGVFVPDFSGYTVQDAMEQRAKKAYWREKAKETT